MSPTPPDGKSRGPGGTALLVVDLQTGTIGRNLMAHPAEGVVANAAWLLRAYHASGATGVLVTTTGSAPGLTTYAEGGTAWPEVLTGLVAGIDAGLADILVQKQGWGAFGRSPLHEQLQERGVSQVVVCGVATSYGVESTAREAYDLGYDVVVVADAVSDPSLDDHERTLGRTIPALGRVLAARDALSLLR